MCASAARLGGTVVDPRIAEVGGCTHLDLHASRSASAIGHRRGRSRRIEVHGGEIDIRKHRRGAGMDDRVGGRAKGQRGRHDFVARADAGGQKRQVQRRRARVERDRERRADVIREFFLESMHPAVQLSPAGGPSVAVDVPAVEGACRQRLGRHLRMHRHVVRVPVRRHHRSGCPSLAAPHGCKARRRNRARRRELAARRGAQPTAHPVSPSPLGPR